MPYIHSSVRVPVLLFSILISLKVQAGNKIKVYFNNPVNSSVSTGVNAIYLPGGTMADTIVAYINRAKYTLDIAQYDYNQDTWNGAFANIAAAVNNAYSRGITVRWIYDGSSSNHGLSALNAGINTLGRPDGSSGIMHDKFIIIDANSTDPGDAILSTGSEDWSSEMMYKDYNNILFIQDSALARAYTAEFNMMWGSTTATPNAGLAKFGPAKTDLGAHNFYVDGTLIELYFSPSDGTNGHILSSIASANTDIYAGVYCFTETASASNIVSKNMAGVYASCIVDQYTYTASRTVYNTLNTGLGSSNFREYRGSYIYHNKLMIVDPSDICSDPQVLTGSHNWTFSADTYNDENTIIIHNDTIANIYYQAYSSDFASLGGALTAQAGCGLGAPAYTTIQDNVNVSPNPSDGDIAINYQLASSQNVGIGIYNVLGQKIASLSDNEPQAAGSHSYNYTIPNSGIYFIQFTIGSEHFTKKLVVSK